MQKHELMTPGTIVTIPGEYLAVVQYVTPTYPYLANVAVAAEQGLTVEEMMISVAALDPALCWCGEPADGCTRMGKPVCFFHAQDGWERLNGEDSFPPARDEHAGSPVDETLSNLIDLADQFRIAANAADHIHTVQSYGHAYGDAQTALMNLLHRAYGTDAADVHEAMIDSGIGHAEAAEYVFDKKLDAEAVRIYGTDGGRYSIRNESGALVVRREDMTTVGVVAVTEAGEDEATQAAYALIPDVRSCRDCGEPITPYDMAGWVGARENGPFDYCNGNTDDRANSEGHRPAKRAAAAA